MTTKTMSLEEDLSQIGALLRRAEDEWYWQKVTVDGPSVPESEGGEERLIRLVETCVLSMLALLERHHYPILARRLEADWLQFRSGEEGVLKGVFPDSGTPYLASLDLIWGFVEALRLGCRPVVPQKSDLQLAERLMRGIPASAAKASVSLKAEADLDRHAEALLIPAFPDLNSNPSISLPVGYRLPDSALPGIHTLVEYKFINDKASVSKILDEIQADIRNYAQPPWEHLLVVTAQQGDWLRDVPYVEQINGQASSFKSIVCVLIRV